MSRMEQPPTAEERGDVILRIKYVPPRQLIIPQRDYWRRRHQVAAASLADEIPSILASRLDSIVTYRKQYDNPRSRAMFTEAAYDEFQIAACSAIAMSRFLRRGRAANHMQQSQITTAAENVLTAFDPAGTELQWHVKQAEEGRLLEVYQEPSPDSDEEWYEVGGIYVRSTRPADPTGDFRSSFHDFFGADARFVPEDYTTLTPVLPRRFLEVVE